jgi:hypothetical protein
VNVAGDQEDSTRRFIGKPSRSADAARAATMREIQSLSARQRLELAFALGRTYSALHKRYRGRAPLGL